MGVGASWALDWARHVRKKKMGRSEKNQIQKTHLDAPFKAPYFVQRFAGDNGGTTHMHIDITLSLDHRTA